MTKTYARARRWAAVIAAILFPASASQGVIFYSTGDPAYNTSAPTDSSLLNSGWQYEGSWYNYLGTPIAPQYFISANHIGGSVGAAFTLNGTTYTTIPFADGSGSKVIPGTDLAIWRIDGTFPSYAPLYNAVTDGNEVGKSIVVFGRGTNRGTEVPGAGWQWGTNAGIERWGQNTVSSLTSFSENNDLRALTFNFDRPTNGNGATNTGYSGVNEATLSTGDSGGGIFINVNGTWKLAGINYGVYPSPFSTTGADGEWFNASLYDYGGLYYKNLSGETAYQGDSGTDFPVTNIASRISPNISAIKYYTNAWRSDANGSFNSSNNWINSLVPTVSTPSGTSTAVGYPAFFGSAISAARTVTVTGSVSVGSLGFDNANSYTLSGTGSITLTNPANPALVQIGVQSGSHTLAINVLLNQNTTVDIAQASSTLSFTTSLAPVSGKSVLLTKTGAGAMAVPNLRGMGLAISGGTVKVPANGTTAGTSLLTSLAISGGKLDVSDNDLILDYTDTSPANSVRNWLLTGRNGGAWTGSGIVSASAAADSQLRTAIGYAEASQLGVTTFSGQTVDTTSLVLKYTWYGDANLDGQVNADDYALIDRGLAQNSTGWVNGDFNYDGVVNSGDYLLIDRVFAQQAGTLSPEFLAQREALFGEAYVSQLIASLPEPASFGACLMAAIPLLRRRR